MCRPYGWVLGPKFSKQGSLIRQIFLKHGWAFQKLAKMGGILSKFTIKVGMTATVRN